MFKRFYDGYLDRSQSFEVFSSTGQHLRGRLGDDVWGEHSVASHHVVCFDVRRLYQTGFPRGGLVYDLKFLYDCDDDLGRLVKRVGIPSAAWFAEAERRFSAHTRAIAGAQMEETLPLSALVPDDVRVGYMEARLRAIGELWEACPKERFDGYAERVWPVFQDVLEIEDARIKVDVPYAEKMAKAKDLATHERRFFETVLKDHRGGFVRTRINPVGSRTWRLRVDGGFNCMAVPHGAPRKAVVSRHEGGSILTLDFNAIDYRCLVAAVDHPLLEFYSDKKDFHAATAESLGSSRDIAKKVTYTHIYGGSLQTLQKSTLLPLVELKALLARADELFAPILEFRTRLAASARAEGSLVTPGGHRVKVEKDDHDGKIVGLFAQTYSSAVFNGALHDILAFLRPRRSRVIFPVHDEFVLDLHPEDAFTDLPDRLVSLVEGKHDYMFTLKWKEGKSYGECTDG